MRRRRFIAATGLALGSGCLRFDGGSSATETETETDGAPTTTDRTTTSTATDEPTSEADDTATQQAETDMNRMCDGNPIPTSVETTWPLAHGDAANTNYRPDETVASEKPCIAWQVPSSAPLHATVVGNDIVLKGNADDHLTAWDRVTGEVAWSTEESMVDTLSYVRWPQIDDGTVYCSAFNGRTSDKPVYALDATDGTVQWSNALDTPTEVKTGTTVANGYVYVAATTNASTIYALSPEDGSVAWQRSIEGDVRIANTPFGVDADRVYVPLEQGDSGPGGVLALDADSGTEAWYADIGSTSSSPTVGPDRLYVTNNAEETIHAVDKTTGEKQWGFETLNGSDEAPALADGEVYYATGDKEVYRLDAATGRPQWKGTIDTRGYGTSVTVTSDTVLVGGDDVDGTPGLYAFDRADGTERWKFTTGLSTQVSPAVVGGVIYLSVGSHDGDQFTLALA